MTKRERILVGIVVGVFALLLNVFLIKFFLKNQRTLRLAKVEKQIQLDGMKQLLSDRAVWEERAAWVAAKQPKMENQASAGVNLLDQVRVMAKQHAVQIKPETLTIGTPEKRPYCTAVPVNIETTSTWQALLNFLNELQGPEKFIALERAEFAKDTADQTQMTAKFRIAKWYAPE